jgi:D-alanyl-lipoteichoic acid acyltransferase DltB (MBOAT superfamily)
MEITSLYFLFFVFGILIIYHLLPYYAQNYWLLIASYVFYISWSWKLAILLLAATVFHFELAKRLRSDGQGRTMLLWTGVGANILLFVIFKASSFYLSRLGMFLEQMGIQSGLGGLQIVVPLGLSYYVLQNISYLVDVYRGQMAASRNLVEFALYLAYFPKMVAGPIERARTFLPTLARPRRVENEALSRSLVLILIGLGRKLLIADLLFAHLPMGELTGTPDVFSKLELIGWMSVYAFALYNDFAGYTSIVRGFSGLFGIELSPNFNTPYFSKSFTEFWTRWHITLSQWLRDYIFFPVSRVVARGFTNRNGWQNIVIPAIITMLVSGFWHQPNWQMLLWGALHGLYLVGERVITLRQPPGLSVQKPYWMGWISMGIVFFLVVVAWVPFMMRVSSAIDVWNQLLVGPIFGFRDYRLFYSLSILAVALGLDYAQYRKADEVFFLRLNPTLQSAILATVLALLLIVSSAGEGQPFVYQGF